MARYISFKYSTLVISLCICMCFAYAELNEDAEVAIPVTGGSNATEDELSIDSKSNIRPVISDSEPDEVHDDESASGNSMSGDSISNDDNETLTNGQPIDIVNKFNINHFGDETVDVDNQTIESISNENVTLTTGNVTDVINGTIVANLNNTNSSKPNVRWPCKPYTILAANGTLSPSVVIINNETTLGNVITSMNGTKECGVLLFYSPFCEFCTSLAPLYNAVGRSYNNLIVIASDAQKVMGMSARYGIVGIPTMLLFYSGKPVAKYNRSRTIDGFKQFIHELTGLSPTIDFNITRDDEDGPISSTPKESRDYYLLFSLSFAIVFLICKLLGSCLKNSLLRIFNRIKSVFKREKID